MFDGKAFGEALVVEVRDYVERATAPLLRRIAELEARPLFDADQVKAVVNQVIADLPPPERGEKGDVGEKGDPGEVNMAALLSTVSEMVAEQVSEQIAGLPVPEKGEKGDPGERGEKGDRGDDGAGIADLLIDREHELIATFTDGRMKNLGRVVGERGEPGEKGEKGDPGDIGERGEIGPMGEKGERGDQGERGPEAYVGEAKGLYDPEAVYRALDVVSFNGSEWRAKRDDPGELPGDGWMLSASRGKRGEKGERGDPGREGREGATLVASYIDMDSRALVQTLSSGEEITSDLSPIIRMVRDALQS